MRPKVLNKQGSAALSYAATSTNPLDMDVIHQLEQGFPSVFLKFSVAQVSPIMGEVEYDISRMVTISEYLKGDVSVRKFKDVLIQLWQLIDACTKLRLPLKNVVFDSGMVYYDSWGTTLRFIYLPFQGIDPDLKQVRTFFAELPGYVKKPNPEVAQLCDQYNAYFKRVQTFNPLDFSAFLSNLATGRTMRVDVGGKPTPAPQAKSAKVAPQKLAAEDAMPTAKTPFVSDSEEEPVAKEAAHAGGDESSEVVPFDDSTGAIFARAGHAAPPREAEDSDSVEDEDDVMEVEEGKDEAEISPQITDADDEKAALGDPPVISIPDPAEPVVTHADDSVEGSVDEPKRASGLAEASKKMKGDGVYTLFRCSKDETITIDRPRFIVGSSKYASYCIDDDANVSRCHAMFFIEDGCCWVEDDDSLNGTYINGTQLEPFVRTKITDGDTVRLGDESFVFSDGNA